MAGEELKKSKRRIQFAQFTTVVSVTLVMMVLGALGLLFLVGHRLSIVAKQQFTIQLVLADDIEAGSISALLKGIKTQPFVREAKHISPEAAAQEYLEFYQDDVREVLEVNPFPHLIELGLKAEYVHADSLPRIEKALIQGWPKQISALESDPFSWEQVRQNLQLAGWVLGGVLAILTLIMLFLINNTIRLSIYSRRHLIRTMQLVGATSSFIRKPFLLAGWWQGLVSSLLGIALTWLAALYLLQHAPELNDPVFFQGLAVLSGLIALLSFASTWFSTWMAVRKFLRLSANRIHL
jgi:cell division transport system permease protein